MSNPNDTPDIPEFDTDSEIEVLGMPGEFIRSQETSEQGYHLVTVIGRTASSELAEPRLATAPNLLAPLSLNNIMWLQEQRGKSEDHRRAIARELGPNGRAR